MEGEDRRWVGDVGIERWVLGGGLEGLALVRIG